MTARTVHLDIVGNHGSVVVGDVDVSEAVRGLTLDCSSDDAPTLRLDLLVRDVDAAVEGARVVIPEATREALVALGWTPPAVAS